MTDYILEITLDDDPCESSDWELYSFIHGPKYIDKNRLKLDDEVTRFSLSFNKDTSTWMWPPLTAKSGNIQYNAGLLVWNGRDENRGSENFFLQFNAWYNDRYFKYRLVPAIERKEILSDSGHYSVVEMMNSVRANLDSGDRIIHIVGDLEQVIRGLL